MTGLDKESVKNSLMSMLKELREDWEYSGELTDRTGIFRDLGFESIDAVALGAAIEEHFGQALPFAEFLTQAREQNLDDITIGGLLEFLMMNLKGVGGKVTQ
jgi:acyl carrier protein